MGSTGLEKEELQKEAYLLFLLPQNQVTSFHQTAGYRMSYLMESQGYSGVQIPTLEFL